MTREIKSLSDEEKTEFLGYHVYYEFALLDSCFTHLLNKEAFDKRNMHKIILESFLIHARCLFEFFYSKPDERYLMDARAEDFFEKTDDWKNNRPKTDIYGELMKRIGKELAHLTIGRAKIVADPYECKRIYTELSNTMRVFIETLPTKYRGYNLTLLLKRLKTT